MDSKNQIQKREIKFRAWDGKKMYLPEYTDREDFHIEADGTIVFTREYGFERHELTNRRDDNWILMQFTGLLDKNGKEIYEGDIITSKLYPFQDGYKHDIYFKNGDYRVRWTMFRLSEMFEHTHTEIEVIGNLYENPDLL